MALDNRYMQAYIDTMKRTSLYFSDEQHRRLQQLSDQTGVPFAVLVRRAVDSFLAYADSQTWEQFLNPQYSNRSSKRKAGRR